MTVLACGDEGGNVLIEGANEMRREVTVDGRKDGKIRIPNPSKKSGPYAKTTSATRNIRDIHPHLTWEKYMYTSLTQSPII